MTRANRLLPFLCLALATPACADDLPFFAGGDLPSLKAPGSPDYQSAPQNPWEGLTLGASAFGVSGSGHGSRGGFGGDTFIGYNHEFDNNIVVGVQGSVGYLPGLYKYGPGGYNFGMANVNVGYDLGRFMPYVSFGVGTANATNLRGVPGGGLDSVNNLFNGSGQSTTLTSVGAGFNYAITDKLHVGASFTAVQAHGGFGPPLAPQPGALP